MEEEVKAVLLNLGFQPDEIFLETTSDGKIAGHIVSDRFEGKDQRKRQDDLWKDLEAAFQDSAKLRRIVAILTMTPGEVEDESESEAA